MYIYIYIHTYILYIAPVAQGEAVEGVPDAYIM